MRNANAFIGLECNHTTDKTTHRDSTDCPHSGPIRPGSVLHRVLEMVAAEIVRKLSATRGAIRGARHHLLAGLLAALW